MGPKPSSHIGQGAEPALRSRPAPYYPHSALPPVSRGSLHSALLDAGHRACGHVWAWPASNNAKELQPNQQGSSDWQFPSDPAIASIVTCSAKWGLQLPFVVRLVRKPWGRSQTFSEQANYQSFRIGFLVEPLEAAMCGGS